MATRAAYRASVPELVNSHDMGDAAPLVATLQTLDFRVADPIDPFANQAFEVPRDIDLEILSVPTGAELVQVLQNGDRQVLGNTPAVLDVDHSTAISLELSLTGHERAVVRWSPFYQPLGGV